MQVASMVLGAAVAFVTAGVGLRRTFALGLAILALGSVLGGLAPSAPWMLVSRAVEGIGFLLVTVSAPPLIRNHAPVEQVGGAMGWWSAFQGIGLFLTLLSTILLLNVWRWPVWWFVFAALTAALVPLALRVLPDDSPPSRPDAATIVRPINATVRTRAPSLLGVMFACYTVQWGAVLGFLKTVLQSAGVAPVLAGVLTALVGGANGVGNIVAGRLLQAGRSPRALVLIGLVMLGAMSTLVFAPDWTAVPGGPVWQVGAAFPFSGLGAFVPATLNRLSVEAAPPGGSPTAVVGLMTQVYNAANFVGPIVLAWVASTAGHWHASWLVTVAAALLGAVLASRSLGRDGLAVDWSPLDVWDSAV